LLHFADGGICPLRRPRRTKGSIERWEGFPVKTDRQNYTKVQYGYGSRASAIPFAIHTLTAAT
jgi:hypothetical protein